MTSTRNTSIARVVLVLALLLALIGAVLANRGGDGSGSGTDTQKGAGVRWLYPPGQIAGVTQRLVGHGTHAAMLLWSEGKPPPRDVVVFLHSWLPKPPLAYAGWMRHLTQEGNTVVYPVYQEMLTKPEAFRANALAGIAAGLRAVHADPAGLVAVGDNTGAALAFDYAAVATSRGLPPPRAVLAAFPGRNPGNGEVTPADLSRIPPRTLLDVVAGPGDLLPEGEAQARTLLRGATGVSPGRRRYLAAPRVSGPRGENARSRRAFWLPLDRLIAAVRGQV